MDSNEERIALANKDARVKDAIAHANAKGAPSMIDCGSTFVAFLIFEATTGKGYLGETDLWRGRPTMTGPRSLLYALSFPADYLGFGKCQGSITLTPP